MKPVRIASDRTVKLPVEVTKSAGFHPGDRVVVIREGDALVLVPLASFESTRGMASGDYMKDYRERPAGS